MLVDARKKDLDDKLFIRWIPYQEAISFDDFKRDLMPGPQKPTEEILKDVEGYIDIFNNGLNKVDMEFYGDL